MWRRKTRPRISPIIKIFVAQPLLKLNFAANATFAKKQKPMALLLQAWWPGGRDIETAKLEPDKECVARRHDSRIPEAQIREAGDKRGEFR